MGFAIHLLQLLNQTASLDLNFLLDGLLANTKISHRLHGESPEHLPWSAISENHTYDSTNT
jgi:hypothetical protein